MKIRMRRVCTVLLLHLIVVAFPANAFSSRGTINARYSYEKMELERDEKGDCYLKGSIINRTHKRKENVGITFYAMSLHGQVLWRLRIKVDIIGKFGSFPFVKKIKQCHKKTPYKFEFKVADRNK